MERRKLSLVVAFMFTLCLATRREETNGVEYEPTPGETVVVESEIDESGIFRYRIEAFPNELYYGDSLYLGSFIEFISEERISDHSLYVPPCFSSLAYLRESWEISITSPRLDGEYRRYKETFDRQEVRDSSASPSLRIYPGEKSALKNACLEFPPLEDMENSFWTELREKLRTCEEGVECVVRVHENYKVGVNGYQNSRGKSATTEFKIIVKSRPQREMELLERWYKNTPEELFPILQNDVKRPRDEKTLMSSERSDIELLGEKCDPYAILRLGYRKPSVPNNPTTLDGWRELESNLIPSAMRDEVRLTRLRLECFAAEDEDSERAAVKELRDWLKSLPEIQRGVMTHYSYQGLRKRGGAPLKDESFGKKRSDLTSLRIQLDPYRLD